MKTIRKGGHRVPSFLEGLSTIFDLGGFLHPQTRALGDFTDDAAAARSDWASVISQDALNSRRSAPRRGEPARRTSPEGPHSRTPGQDQNLPG